MFPALWPPTAKTVLYVILGLSAIQFCACSSIPPQARSEDLTRARSSVEAAERADAKQLAPEALRRAQDALAIAADAYTRQEWDRTARFARQAELYALMAVTQTEERRLGEELALVRQQLEDLHQQVRVAMQNDTAAAVAADTSTASALPAVTAQSEINTPAAAVQPASDTISAQEVKP
jgi:hypothetical protein